MTEDYIDVYGGYAIKLLRLQNEMIQTFDRYRGVGREREPVAECTVEQACTSAGGVTPSAGGKFALHGVDPLIFLEAH